MKHQEHLSLGQNLQVSLNITDTKYNIKWPSLFSMAARKNPKRDFIFVSKVLGKHIPIKPITLDIIGAILCRLWVEKRENYIDPDINILVEALEYFQVENHNKEFSKDLLDKVLNILSSPIELKHKTLFIGFAETATGIAQAVFGNSLNSHYIHTTRETVSSVKESIFFREEHSHATNHSLYPLNPQIFEEVDDIVLIDDEITTGKTALNLMKNLPSSKHFGIISILDWRSKENIEIYNQETTIKIDVCSLMEGTITCNKSGELGFEDISENYTNASLPSFEEISIKNNYSIDQLVNYTGRFGISSDQQDLINEETNKISDTLKQKRVPGNCLCLGTGEFIYLPCKISGKLGENIFYHSTTRSPVYPLDNEEYAIKNKVTFPSPDDENLNNYVYNIPKDFYKQAFVFSEKSFPQETKDTFLKIMGHFSIENVIFVSWN